MKIFIKHPTTQKLESIFVSVVNYMEIPIWTHYTTKNSTQRILSQKSTSSQHLEKCCNTLILHPTPPSNLAYTHYTNLASWKYSEAWRQNSGFPMWGAQILSLTCAQTGKPMLSPRKLSTMRTLEACGVLMKWKKKKKFSFSGIYLYSNCLTTAKLLRSLQL